MAGVYLCDLALKLKGIGLKYALRVSALWLCAMASCSCRALCLDACLNGARGREGSRSQRNACLCGWDVAVCCLCVAVLLGCDIRALWTGTAPVAGRRAPENRVRAGGAVGHDSTCACRVAARGCLSGPVHVGRSVAAVA